ncbi:MAG: hypothetical protein WA700_02735 [Acidobacteriaceae bacterium]
MLIWWFVYGVPLFSLMIASVSLFRFRPRPFVMPFAILALAWSTASSAMGIYGLIHVDQLSRRNFFDYGFERRAATVAYLGLVTAIAWLLLGHKWKNLPAWIAFAVSLWMSLVWTAACMTL